MIIFSIWLNSKNIWFKMDRRNNKISINKHKFISKSIWKQNLKNKMF